MNTISRKLAFNKIMSIKNEAQGGYITINETNLNFHKPIDHINILKDIQTRYILVDRFTYESLEMFLLENIRSLSSTNFDLPGK